MLPFVNEAGADVLLSRVCKEVEAYVVAVPQLLWNGTHQDLAQGKQMSKKKKKKLLMQQQQQQQGVWVFYVSLSLSVCVCACVWLCVSRSLSCCGTAPTRTAPRASRCPRRRRRSS